MTEFNYWDQIWTDHPDMRVNNFARRAYRRIQTKNLKTLLDIGCGAGQDSRYFVKQGLHVTALDLAPAGLDRLRSLDSRISCLNQDLCHLNFPDQSFDVVYAHLSLHYFDDSQTRQIFKAIHQILTRNGLFFVKCKSTSDRLFGEGEKAGENMFFYRHLRHFFSREYMAAMLEPFTVLVLSLRKTSSIYGRYPSSLSRRYQKLKRIPITLKTTS